MEMQSNLNEVRFCMPAFAHAQYGTLLAHGPGFFRTGWGARSIPAAGLWHMYGNNGRLTGKHSFGPRARGLATTTGVTAGGIWH